MNWNHPDPTNVVDKLTRSAIGLGKVRLFSNKGPAFGIPVARAVPVHPDLSEDAMALLS